MYIELVTYIFHNNVLLFLFQKFVNLYTYVYERALPKKINN